MTFLNSLFVDDKVCDFGPTHFKNQLRIGRCPTGDPLGALEDFNGCPVLVFARGRAHDVCRYGVDDGISRQRAPM